MPLKLSDAELVSKVHKAIRELEATVAGSSGTGAETDRKPVLDLVEALDKYEEQVIPSSGPYSECQHQIAETFRRNASFEDLIDPGKASRHLREWRRQLAARLAPVRVPVAQVFFGQSIKVDGKLRNCAARIRFFERHDAITALCYTCFKVQILPTSLRRLFQICALLRVLDLPDDNIRKAMVEFREDVPYPYKGYVFCASERDAELCRDKLLTAFKKHHIAARVAISHGCSEYGLRFPDWKYAVDGGHRHFPRPDSWIEAEKEFDPRPAEHPLKQTDFNGTGITLKDIYALETWIDYAELIGDPDWKLFRDEASDDIPRGLRMRIEKQAAARHMELSELNGKRV